MIEELVLSKSVQGFYIFDAMFEGEVENNRLLGLNKFGVLQNISASWIFTIQWLKLKKEKKVSRNIVFLGFGSAKVSVDVNLSQLINQNSKSKFKIHNSEHKIFNFKFKIHFHVVLSNGI